MKTILKKLFQFYKNKNNKVLVNNVFGTLVVKGLAMVITLFTMPVYIEYFDDKEAVGLWFSLVSVLNWILTFDLGVGNGLRNNLAKALAQDDKREAKKLISSAYFFLGIVSLLLLVAGNIAIGFIDINSFLKISAGIFSPEILQKSVRIVFSGVVLQFFLRIISSVFYAIRKTALVNLLTLISSSSALLFVLVCKPETLESRLIALSYAQTAATCLPLFIATVIVFLTIFKESVPSPKAFDLATGKKIMSIGGQFLVIQICLMIITSSNDILVNRLAGVSYVVEYQAYYRIFYMIVTLFSLICQPMWSSFTQAYATKKYKWIRNTYRKFQGVAVLCSLGAVAVALIFDFAARIWLGEDAIESQPIFDVVFCIFIIIAVFGNSATCLANGLNRLGCQVIWSVVGAIVKVPLSVLFVELIGSWIGVVMANAVSLLPLVIFQSIGNERLLKTIRNEWE